MFEDNKRGLNEVTKYTNYLYGLHRAVVTQYLYTDDYVHIAGIFYGMKEGDFSLDINYIELNKGLNIMDRNKKLKKICTKLEIK